MRVLPDVDARRWAVLAVGMLAMMAGSAFQYGLAFLIPALRDAGLTLGEAGTLVTAPVLGVLVCLLAWGALADQAGERVVLAAGLAGAATALTVASRVHGTVLLGVLLVLAGGSGACVHAASGRLILGWFAVHERGVAMGFRQSAQPLGIGVAAVSLPRLSHDGIGPALLFLAALCLLATLLVIAVVRDPRRVEPDVVRRGTPYRGGFLPRIHMASALLVVPQFAIGAYAFDYLVHERSWSVGSAGPLLAAAQLGGAAIRLGAGWWSDRVGSRLRPMRTLALVSGGVLGLLAVGAARGWGLAVVAVVVAAVLTVSTNGLAYTAVAERAGRSWAGRALGIQNTGQNLAAVATPPALAALVTAAGSRYAAAFAVVAAFPMVAAAVVPIAGERGSA